MKFLKTYLPPVLVMIFWSFSYVLTKIAFGSFHPITVVTMRVILATVFMLLFGLCAKDLQPIRRPHLLWFVGLAAFEPFGYFLCEAYGLTMVSSTFAAVILATIPLFSPFVAYVLLRERITWANIVGIIVSVSGVLLISVDNSAGGFVGKPLGVALLFVAVFIAIFYSVAVKKLARYYSETSIVSYQNLFGLLFFVPLFFVVDFHKTPLPFAWEALAAVALLAVFGSALAFVFYARALNTLGVSRTNMFLNLLPVATAFFAFFLLDEQLSVQKMVGIAIVIAGLFVGQIRMKNSE